MAYYKHHVIACGFTRLLGKDIKTHQRIFSFAPLLERKLCGTI